jgi:predicted DCC family thiol-disulfide oxidoreductase YuxK
MPVEGKVGISSKRPTTPVLIYDADCAFCARWVQRLRHWDHKHRVTYLPLRDDRALGVSGRERQKLQGAAHFVRPDGAVFAGAAAARELFAFLPLGSLPRIVMSLPGVMPIATRVYAWIARRYGPVMQ